MESLSVPTEKLFYSDVTLLLDKMVPGVPERGLVPYYHFRIITNDGVDVGHINFRVGDTEHVRLYAGHIGYEVLEAFRGHHYALKACYAIARFVRSIYPSVIITADPDNRPSLRTIEMLGAVFLDEIPVAVEDPHYQRGSRWKRRFLWVPEEVSK